MERSVEKQAADREKETEPDYWRYSSKGTATADTVLESRQTSGERREGDRDTKTKNQNCWLVPTTICDEENISSDS